MEERQIKAAMSGLKGSIGRKGSCPDEADLSRFVEGTMGEKETEQVEKHLISCQACCDCVVALNKVIHFPEGEPLPDVPEAQIVRATALVQERKKEKHEPLFTRSVVTFLDELAQSIKEFFTLEWMAQPVPVRVRSGAAAFALILICTVTYIYYQQSGQLGVQIEIMGKTKELTRGIPTGKTIERVIKEGDTLFSNDFCRRIFFNILYNSNELIILVSYRLIRQQFCHSQYGFERLRSIE